MPHGDLVATLDHETSDVTARDWDRNSKIRRHCPMRLDEPYTARAVPMAWHEKKGSVRVGPNCGSRVPVSPRKTCSRLVLVWLYLASSLRYTTPRIMYTALHLGGPLMAGSASTQLLLTFIHFILACV